MMICGQELPDDFVAQWIAQSKETERILKEYDEIQAWKEAMSNKRFAGDSKTRARELSRSAALRQITELRRLKQVRTRIHEMLQLSSYIPTVIKVNSEKYSELQCVLQDWLYEIEEKSMNIAEGLRSMIPQPNNGLQRTLEGRGELFEYAEHPAAAPLQSRLF